MANEADVTVGLSIRKGSLQYVNRQTRFRADVDGAKGPTPGALSVSVEGTDVDFSELESPGFCRITNLDDENFVEYGIWDGTEFFPLGEILPGEFYVLRLSRNLGESFETGTGTVGDGSALRIKADTDSCNVVVEAFER